MAASLIELFARHRVAANLLMIMMILAGAWAVRHINTSMDPSTSFPEVEIEVLWPGASAEDMERLVAIPVEQNLRTLADLDELFSRSEPGRAMLWATFTHDADMGQALDQVKQRVANIRNLPDETEPPRIARVRDRELIASILVTGPGDIRELIPLVRTFERDLLARGVDAIELDGLPEEELAIMVSSRELAELGLGLEGLAAEVAAVSQDVPAGIVGRAQGARQLRSLEQRHSGAEFDDVQLQMAGQVVRLGDVAEITQRPRDDQIRVARNGEAAIEMYLMRYNDSDALQAAKVMREWVAETRPTLPPGVELHVMKEIWTLLSGQLSMLGKNGLSGLVLVIAVLMLFLNGRVAGWVSIGIPVSFLLALAIYWGLFDGGINIVALIGFIMALGIVVDDAIVVGEDTVALYEQGHDAEAAAIGGARRMLVPVVTSSLTTMAAFAPLLLFGGPMGDIILTLPTVLLCIILASLVECFLILPNHLKTSLARMSEARRSDFRERFDAAFLRFRGTRFEPLLHRALDNPGATLAAALAITFIAFALVASNRVGVNFAVGMDLESLEGSVQYAASATPEDKQAFLAHLQDTLQATAATEGENNVVGWITKENFTIRDDTRYRGAEYAYMDVEYALEEHRTRTPMDFLAAWRARIEVPPIVEDFQLRRAGGLNNGRADITFRLRGGDVVALKSAADELAQRLAAFGGVTEVSDDMPWGREQWIFSLTPDGRALGLTPASLGRQLRAAYSGRRVQIINKDGTELEVRVMLADAERGDLSSLRQFPVLTDGGALVPLGSVARLETRRGVDIIRHMDGELAVRVNAWVDPQAANALQIQNDVREQVLPDIEARYDVSSGLTGASKQNEMMMLTLTSGFLLTLIFIYLILAWVFSSYLWPLAIMTAIPFGLTGAIFGHAIMGADFGTMSMLAFFALTGVVVNDSIVLVTFLRRAVDAGTPLRTALEESARSRFRAVLLTSVTTIAGLAPLMFEPSSMAMFIQPIAITICFGLAVSTLLVLLVVPALILLMEALKASMVSTLQGLTERLHTHPAAASTTASATIEGAQS